MPNVDQETLTTAPDGRPLEHQPAWRRDFPIDWPQDNYVARRDFTKFLVLTSFAFVVGQFWIALQNLWRKTKGQPPIREIASVGHLKVGDTISFSYPEAHDKCLLTRIEENTYVAYNQACTHLSCAVIPEPAKNRLWCPCHNGAFDLATGAPTAGPPRRPLERIKLDFKNGRIYAVGKAGEGVHGE